MVGVNAARVVFHLTGLDLFQQIVDVSVVCQSYLDAHGVQALHSGLSHAAADEKLTIIDIIELGHVRRVSAHAVMVVMIVVVMMVVVAASVGQLPQLLSDDLTIVKGDNEEGFGLPEMSGNGDAVVGGDSDFDCHNGIACDECVSVDG